MKVWAPAARGVRGSVECGPGDRCFTLPDVEPAQRAQLEKRSLLASGALPFDGPGVWAATWPAAS